MDIVVGRNFNLLISTSLSSLRNLHRDDVTSFKQGPLAPLTVT